jgi:hypothetical protein
VTVKEYQQGTLAIVSNPFDTRAKVLYLAYSIMFGLGGLFLLGMSASFYGSPVGAIILLAIGIGFLIGCYRFGHAAMLQEQIFIDGKEFILITRGIGTKKRQVFELASISNFRLLEKPVMAPHPLAGESFDYLGFQTEQQVINEMYGDNRLAFDYEGIAVKFGENVIPGNLTRFSTF